MKRIKKILLLIMLVVFAFSYNAKADSEILTVDKIEQIENNYNVSFEVVNNNEVNVKYEDLGDTLEFEVTIKNSSTDYDAIIKNVEVVNENEGIEYETDYDGKSITLKPNETKKYYVKGVMNINAINGDDIAKVKITYTTEKIEINPNTGEPTNPKTGDNIYYFVIILLLCLIGLLLVLTILSKNNKFKKIPLVLSIIVGCFLIYPIYKISAEDKYTLEVIINQKILINKADDTISFNEVEKNYDGEETEVIFNNLSDSEVTPIYYSDDTCETSINGNPVDSGIYYVTATSEGNNWYKPGVLECTKAVTINKVDSSCPTIQNVTAQYDENEHSLIVGDNIVGGELYYSLDNDNYTNEPIKVKNFGVYEINTKVVGDKNHNDKDCGNNTITINKKDITINATNQTKVYDGTPLVADSTCELVGDYNDYLVECTSEGEITNVGETDKVLTGATITKDDIDVSNNYNMTLVNGLLSVTRQKTANPGVATNPTYNGDYQSLVTGGNAVTYTNDYGKDADEYTILATCDPNYAFEDGTTIKSITSTISKRNIEITPIAQNVPYGDEISKTIDDVVVTNMVVEHNLKSITLTEVTECNNEPCLKIVASNAEIIDSSNTNVTNNYNITYNDGTLTRYKKDDTITVNEVTDVYTGEEIEGDFSNISNTEITPVYYSDSECQNAIEGKPINAGTYYATATSPGNNIYKEASLACSKVVTINKAASVCPTIQDVTVTFDNDSHSLIVRDNIVGGVLNYSEDNITFNEAKIEKINAGIYTIYTKVVGDINHNDEECGTNTITINQKADTITVNEATTPYTGNPIAGVFADESETPITPIYYSDNTCETAIAGNPIDAGIYYATATSTGNNNYSAGTLECSKVVTINKIDSSCPTISGVEVDYDGNPYSLIVGSDIVGGVLNYSIDNANWSPDSITRVEPGTYNIYTKVVGDNNHNNKSCGNDTIKINKLNDAITATEVVTPYTGEEVEGNFSTISNLEVNPTYYSDNTCETEVVGKIKNVGTYFATAETNGNNYYNKATLACTKVITINKVASTCPAVENVSETYTGNSYSLTIGEGLSGGTLNYSLNDGEWSTTNPSVRDVGIYTIKTKVVGDENHNNENCGSNTIEIKKKDDTITVNEVTRDYTGEAVEGNFSSNSESAITPTYYTDDTCETSISGNPVNAVVYYATATSAGNEFYNPATLECTKAVTINKVSSTCPSIQNVNEYYDKEDHSLIVGDDIEGGTLYYQLNDGEWTTEPIVVNEAGTYIINTKVVGDNNHNDNDCGTNSIIITKRSVTITTENQSKVYDGDPLEADQTCELLGDYDDYSVDCVISGSITDVGQTDKVIESVAIYYNGDDVTDLFDLRPQNGSLTITASRTAQMGECYSNLIYDGSEQYLVDTWNSYNVTYTNDTGTNAGDYSITVTADPNYEFEDGTNVKTMTCSINRKPVTLKALPQDIKYGTTISKTLQDVVFEGEEYGDHALIRGDSLRSVSLTQERTTVVTEEEYESAKPEEADDNWWTYSLCGSKDYFSEFDESYPEYPICSGISLSNAVIENENNEDVTSNYDITYKKGLIAIYYELELECDENCYTSSDIVHWYHNNLSFGKQDDDYHDFTIDFSEGYKMIQIKLNGNVVQTCADDYSESGYDFGECYNFDPSSINISGNSKINIITEDLIPPEISSAYASPYDYYYDGYDFSLEIYAFDVGSGINKVEWYYRKCGSEDYSKLTEFTYNNERDISGSESIGMCLNYGDYYVYAIVYDAAGNHSQSEVTEFRTRTPNAEEIKVNKNYIGTNCNSLGCAVEELDDYFEYYSNN